MKTTIILPVFNRRHLITQTLYSILGQTVRPHEVIAIDDGSTDGTAEMVEDFANAFPHFPLRLIRQANAGPAAARNAGFKATTGDFIALWDSDDLCPAYRLEKQLALFAAHPALDFVFGNEAQFEDDNTLTPVRLDHGLTTGPIADIRQALVNQVNIPTSTVMIRRSSVWAVKGMDESLRLCEDMDFWIRLMRNGAQFGIVNEVLVHRRIHAGNLISQRRKLKEAEAFVLDRYDCLGGDVLRWKASSHHYDLGSHYFRRADWQKAREHLSKVMYLRGIRRLVLWIKSVVCLTFSHTPSDSPPCTP